MRVYQLRHYEVMMPEENWKEAQNLLYYEQLCYEMLTIHAISFCRAVEVIKISKGKIEHRPSHIQRMLNREELPAFCFIIGKN